MAKKEGLGDREFKGITDEASLDDKALRDGYLKAQQGNPLRELYSETIVNHGGNQN